MSQYGTLKNPTYKDGRTKQSFRDETDINVILKRAQKTGTISHLNKHQGVYADFSTFDFQTNIMMLSRGREIFDDLPPELRSEFNQSPEQFFGYVNDPANKDRLAELLPALAEPGRQNMTLEPPKADEAKALEKSVKPAPISAEMRATEEGPASTTIRKPEEASETASSTQNT